MYDACTSSVRGRTRREVREQARERKRPLHVLTLTPFYPSDYDEAAGCFVAEPLEALAKTGVVNTVFAAQPAYRKSTARRDSGWHAEWLRYLSLPGGLGLPTAGAFLFARIVGRVRELRKLGQIDLVHAHAPLPGGHAALLLSMELGVPYVVSVHGLDAFSTKQVSGRAGDWCRKISQRVYRSSRRVICVSERVREQVLEGAGTCRTSVVYNGVDPELFSPGTESGTEPQMGADYPQRRQPDPDQRARCAHPRGGITGREISTLTLEIIGDGPERPSAGTGPATSDRRPRHFLGVARACKLHRQCGSARCSHCPAAMRVWVVCIWKPWRRASR